MSAVEEDIASIRTMGMADLDEVGEIEKSAYQFPWNTHIFCDCLKAGYVGRVYLKNNSIVGYGIMSLGAGEAHILNLCVHPQYQNQTIGTRLMQDMLAIAARAKTRICFLEVRVANHKAHTLYGSLGFNQIGTRKNYYPGVTGREDAYVLAKVMD